MSERLSITALAHRGDGIAETPAGPVFVPYALPGEVVEVETTESADRRRLLSVVDASPERVGAICPHFGACGGCTMQHWKGEHYRAWKRGLLVSALTQAGIETPVGGLVEAHGEGRRRATFHARRGADGVLRVGFAAQREHQIVAIEQCPVLASGLAGAISVARALAATLTPEGKPLDIQVTATDGGLDVDVRGSGPLAGPRLADLAKLAAKHRVARLTRHGELVVQNAPPAVAMGRARVTLPPGSFLQATVAGEQALASLVLGHAKAAKSVADLFCGVGPFALRLAERARVFAADSNADAVAALKQAATAAQGLKPIEAVARDLFRRPLVAQELKRFDAVLLDPPRQGAEAQARELSKSGVPLVVSVSCSVATFTRDAKTLIGGGYRLTAVTPVDQFLYSPHVEIVGRFER